MLASPGAAAAPARPVWVVLIDRSLDSPLATRSDGVKAAAAAGNAAIKPRGKVYADGFTSKALSRLRFPVTADFGKPPPTYSGENPTLIRIARQAQVAQLAAETLRVLFPNLRVRGTDITGAVLAASKGPLDNRRPGLIILLSNMLLWSAEDKLFFTNSAPLTSREREATLGRLAAAGRIPNLHGRCVLVVGAGRLDKSTIGTTRYLAVEKFWRRYFVRAHAHLAGWRPSLPSKLPAPCGGS